MPLVEDRHLQAEAEPIAPELETADEEGPSVR
jgi:hypothetical protein